MPQESSFRGFLLLLVSALSFSASTMWARMLLLESSIHPFQITFFRFSAGFLVVLPVLISQRISLKPEAPRAVAGRAIFNTAAVMTFFFSLSGTTVTKANMLNMTYPAFVFVIAPFLNREPSLLRHFLFLILTLTGSFIVMSDKGGTVSFSSGDLTALASAVLAALAISALREARKHDNSWRILFYLMLTGSIVNLIFMVPLWKTPDIHGIFLLFLITVSSVFGQLLITAGYRYINAAPGALVSSSRILFAAFLGVLFLQEPFTLQIGLGGMLIFISLIGVSGYFSSRRS